MSESDDTDILLLIPPDLFHVPSSDSEGHSDSDDTWHQRKSGIVSELVDHMQTLESRISAIESKDTNTLNLNRLLSVDSLMSSGQTLLPRTKLLATHRQSSVQSSPTKISQCYSLPSTLNIHQKLNYIDEKHRPLSCSNASLKRDSSFLNKSHHSKSLSESFDSQGVVQSRTTLRAGSSPGKESHVLISSAPSVGENNISYQANNKSPLLTSAHILDHKSTRDMNLPEVNKLFKEIQSNAKSKISQNHNPNGYSIQIDTGTSGNKNLGEMTSNSQWSNNRMEQQQKFISNNHSTLLHESMHSLNCDKRKDHLDCTLLDTSFSSFDTERFNKTDFKTWNSSLSQDTEKINKIDLPNFQNNENTIVAVNVDHEENKKKNNDQYNKTNFYSTSGSKSCPNILKSSFLLSESPCETTVLTSNIISDSNCLQKNSASDINDYESNNRRSHRLLTLSDIWNQDSCKPRDERMRLKLEEEQLRREHCEQVIQELQKKLLEHQEKIAVAVSVDNEKNAFISQFQVSWVKMKHKLYKLETERENHEKLLKTMSEKQQLEIDSHQKQIDKYKEELSQAINLATGYKEKSDAYVKEKVELLKNHADELQNYQTLLQQSEMRYEEKTIECQKLLEKNKSLDETLQGVKQDLGTELMKSKQIRDELTVIHKALDACETELVILRQEKENLQIMLREENSRNIILEKDSNSLTTAVDEAQKAEKLAKNQVKSLAEQQEKLRAELRDVYQKQVDQVVKTKLDEFQTQLDSAEAVFQNEVETKQRAIAECAARKIKSVMDKHQLEIHLVEEKHKEEKKLLEIKLAQAVQKAAILEAQLNSYRKSKSQLIEQLYSMLQKQWQQALVIISGSNGENVTSFQKMNIDKFFNFPNGQNLQFIPEHCSTLCTDPTRSGEQKNMNAKSSQAQEVQNESLITLTSNEDSPLTNTKESKSDLKKYIKMILDIQQKDDCHELSVAAKDSVARSSQRQVPCKPSSQANNISTPNERNSKWESISEVSIHDTSEYLSPPQIFAALKSDRETEKPPWK